MSTQLVRVDADTQSVGGASEDEEKPRRGWGVQQASLIMLGRNDGQQSAMEIDLGNDEVSISDETVVVLTKIFLK
ncbi:hypothetical protein Z517_09330 [Fonsecaea pedrosoi CBS 271.37]|uniref:Uncharacterized protein n=1 Tax=Fonsecaea pedrosoi CBS 271.37 TaxID=1442368 RepID=A0A0D2DGS9_9EURO|nr:uncharacterized protein Z517_09330 [Fonsecaea pedrosoi CBS 271.37]KIW76886.1 hypothetical protein Z517_09330 [Fonsecaea pedrosoi CBS 271.37]